MKSWEKPTPEEINRAIALLSNEASYKYFFDRLENPEWLEPMWEKGFFRNPPPSIRIDEEGMVSYPTWPESRYLARMAKHKPELVANIIKEMSDTDNVSVHISLLDALLNMPPNIAKNVIEKPLKWAEFPILLLPEKLGQLISHLAKGGEVEEALTIAKALLDIKPYIWGKGFIDSGGDHGHLQKPKAKFDDWEYNEIIKKYYPDLAKEAGLPALELLCDILEKAIRISRISKDYDGPEDVSFIWRPAIEDHPQNLGHSLKDYLVSGIRDICEIVIKSGKASIEQVVSILEHYNWKIFHRISLHILRVFRNDALPLIKLHLMNRDTFNDGYLSHEYVSLLRACYDDLSADERETILEWINKGPDVEGFIRRWQDRTSSIPTQDEILRYKSTWQRDRLDWIGVENLPPGWKEKYHELVRNYGEPEHPEFTSYGTFTFVGPTSPKTQDELREMSVNDIVDYLKLWTPPESIFGEPSPEGLGRSLSSVVAEEPRRFALEAELFQGLDPTYVRHLLTGFRESLRNKKEFDWEPVLNLCHWVLAQPREIENRRFFIEDMDPDWGWTRKAIAGLLSMGFQEIPGSIPAALRSRIWSLLLPLTEDPELSVDYEEEYGGSNRDPLTISINTVRGEAMHAVIRYALWVRRNMEKELGDENFSSKGFSEMPEVKDVLDAHLDLEKESSLAIRAVYGQWYPYLVYLDKDWARKNCSRIFPLDESLSNYFNAAWNAYIVFNYPRNDVFDILYDIYNFAVERIGLRGDGARWIADPDDKLAEHIMVGYWSGNLNFGDSMFTRFWESASDEVRAHAISFIGSSLQQTKEKIPEDIIKRLMHLWEMRVSIAEREPNEHKEELAAFGWWFISRKFDVAWAIGQLERVLKITYRVVPVHMIIEYLVEIAEIKTKESVNCLRLIAEGDKEGWDIMGNKDEIRKVIEIAMHEKSSVEEAEKFVHYLGSRGFFEFRDLLNNYA